MIDKLAHWTARHLPRRLVYWATIVLGSEVSTGPRAHQDYTTLTLHDAVREYGA